MLKNTHVRNSMVASSAILYKILRLSDALPEANDPVSGSVLSVSALAIMLYSGSSYFKVAFNTLKNFYRCPPLGMAELVTLNCFSCWTYSAITSIAPDIDTQDIFAAPIITLLALNLCALFKDKIHHKINSHESQSIQRLQSRQPKTAHVNQTFIHYTEIKKDDLVLIKHGETLPIDGQLLNTTARIDRLDMITGEHGEKTIHPSQLVYAGTRNVGQDILIKSICNGDESKLNHMINSIRFPDNDKNNPLRSRLNRLSQYFTPTVIALAIGSLATWYPITKDAPFALMTMMCVLAGACPCTLGLAESLSTSIARLKASQHNIIITDEATIGELNTINTFFFDHTGTLTEPTVTHLNLSLDSPLEENVLQHYCAALENQTGYDKHPIAAAIIRSVNPPIIENGLVELDTSQPLNNGITGSVAGYTLSIGNAFYVESILNSNLVQPSLSNSQEPIFVLVNGVLAGTFIIEHRLKPSVLTVFNWLTSQQKKCIILSGATEATITKTANQLETNYFYHSKSPEDKQRIILKEIQSGNHIIMIGDGANDTLAAKVATISIAIRSSDLAASSDISIPSDLLSLITLMNIASNTSSNVKQNLFIALTYNITMIILGAVLFPILDQFTDTQIRMTPMASGIAMAVSSLIVILNASRLLTPSNNSPTIIQKSPGHKTPLLSVAQPSSTLWDHKSQADDLEAGLLKASGQTLTQ